MYKILQRSMLLGVLFGIIACPLAAMSGVDLGIKGGVGFNYNELNSLEQARSMRFGEKVRVGLVSPVIKINTDLWLLPWLGLSFNFGANLFRVAHVQNNLGRYLHAKDVFLTLANGNLLDILGLPQHAQTHDRYHSFTFDTMAKTGLGWWYVGLGAGAVMHVPTQAKVSIEGFQLVSNYKLRVGLNLVLETGLKIPVHPQGFVTVGGSFRYDVLNLSKEYTLKNIAQYAAKVAAKHGKLNDRQVQAGLAHLTQRNERFFSPWGIEFFVGYTHRFGG